MNVIVCVKQTPDTEAVIKIDDSGKKIVEQGIKFILNPYDEFAVEEALKVKEKLGGTVTVYCLGPQRSVEAIRTALAMGADKSVHLDDPAFLDGDGYATAKALAEAIKKEPFDIIFCGREAVDEGKAEVGEMLAEFLGIPHVTFITSFELSDDGKKAVVKREVEGGEETFEVELPAVFTAQKGLNEPRYPSLPGIMKAKKKELKPVKAADLGLSPDEIGEAGARVSIVSLDYPPERPPGKILEGEPEEVVKELVKLLKEEAKVI